MPLLNNFFQDSKISVVNKNKSIKYLPVDNSDSDSDSDSVVESLILIDKQCEFKNKVNFMMLNRNNTRRNYSSNFDIGQQESVSFIKQIFYNSFNFLLLFFPCFII